ncbi:hypothetical protein BP00DRAFT_201082 [Aspergillus indologenus CBS 114.80]|uniref:Uncharacterized protein n=1 Tax=Aspergillus indologenus CBS 114.80 TaxID=1450541 RepID=A0A2V5IPM1_9EURO|nr:hypothetical protein BP00DRAFT_201082 [Aspergillus indologenus CBS 114.80]
MYNLTFHQLRRLISTASSSTATSSTATSSTTTSSTATSTTATSTTATSTATSSTHPPPHLPPQQHFLQHRPRLGGWDGPGSSMIPSSMTFHISTAANHDTTTSLTSHSRYED